MHYIISIFVADEYIIHRVWVFNTIGIFNTFKSVLDIGIFNTFDIFRQTEVGIGIEYFHFTSSNTQYFCNSDSLIFWFK